MRASRGVFDAGLLSFASGFFVSRGLSKSSMDFVMSAYLNVGNTNVQPANVLFNAATSPFSASSLS